jgi:light-regulated signal transduction histidine kinase (bacteriophytochrome)
VNDDDLNDVLHRELADVAYAVSHDLRSPLRAIGGFSEALAEEYEPVLDEQGREYLGRIRSAAARMERLFDAFRRLGQVSRGEIRRTAVDVTSIADTIAARLRATDPDRDVTFSIERDLSATGDPELLRIAFEQLLENAWKFTRNQPRAAIEVGREEHESRNVFFVRDDGAGFEASHAGRLFVPFQRLHPQSEFEGDGIGLAVVRRIIHRHGGRVWASGETGRGATFRMALA